MQDDARVLYSRRCNEEQNRRKALEQRLSFTTGPTQREALHKAIAKADMSNCNSYSKFFAR